MGQSVMLTGMVLSSMPVGEYDRRVVILTRERGKISGFARGARRPKSAMVGAVNPFCFGQFEVYEGRRSYTIVRALISNYFQEIREDLIKTGYGQYFLEIADYFSMENADGTNQLKLLYQTLRALSVPSLDPRLVRRIYELKTLVFYGVYPDFFHCAACGKTEGLILYSPARAGMLCRSCAGTQIGIQPGDTALYTLQFIVSQPVEKLYTFTVTGEVLQRVEQVVEEAFRLCTGKTFRSLEFLNGILSPGYFP